LGEGAAWRACRGALLLGSEGDGAVGAGLDAEPARGDFFASNAEALPAEG